MIIYLQMKKSDWIIYSIAAILFITLVLMVINSLLAKQYYDVFWYCYIAIFILVIGLIKKNSFIISSQIIILLIPDLLWISDFFYLMFTGNSLLGLTKNFPHDSLFNQVTNLQHLYVVPLSLLALSMIKLKKNYKILLVGLGEITLTFFLTLLFVPMSIINCVHANCVNITPTFLPYYVLWFLFSFSFIIISYLVISNLPFLKKKK